MPKPECVLKLEFTGFAGKLNTKCAREDSRMSHSFGLGYLEGWRCLLLK